MNEERVAEHGLDGGEDVWCGEDKLVCCGKKRE